MDNSSLKADPEKYTAYQFFKDVRDLLRDPKKRISHIRAKLSTGETGSIATNPNAVAWCLIGAGEKVAFERLGVEKDRPTMDWLHEILVPIMQDEPNAAYEESLRCNTTNPYVWLHNHYHEEHLMPLLDKAVAKLEGDKRLFTEKVT